MGMKNIKLFILISHFVGCGVFAGVNSQFSLELKVEPSVKRSVAELVNERLPSDHGFSAEEVETLIQDFAVLATVKGGKSSPLFYEIFSHQKSFSGDWLLQWMMAGTKEFKASRGEACNQFSVGDYNACSNFSKHSMVLTPSYFQNNRISRLLTMIHERRHFDGYDHSAGSHDREIKGARGAQLAFIVSFVNSCSNCTIIAKKNMLGSKDQIVGAMRDLSEDDSLLLKKELAALQSEMPVDISEFLSGLKKQESFISVNHVECKNNIPLYIYQQQQSPVPDVNAQDCFFIYYKKTKSAHLGEQFVEPITRFGALFTFLPVNAN